VLDGHIAYCAYVLVPSLPEVMAFKITNSLPFSVVAAPSVNSFKNILDN